MISLRRPDDAEVGQYLAECRDLIPTCPPASSPPPGFRHDRFRRVVGRGESDFDQARSGLQQWAAHSGSGVDVYPPGLPPEPGSVVALVTRQAGAWLLFVCRVESVVDAVDRYGFVYSTLPGHPESGYESFQVVLDGDDVVFEIDAVSRPGIALVKVIGPVARLLQARATDAYLDALAAWVGGPR